MYEFYDGALISKCYRGGNTTAEWVRIDLPAIHFTVRDQDLTEVMRDGTKRVEIAPDARILSISCFPRRKESEVYIPTQIMERLFQAWKKHSD